jgi:hypothetical protein
VAKTGASAPARAVCSVTWGSASADRSITALKPLPRTPVPRPTGQGSRPPGRSRRRSSEHRPPRSTGARQTAPFGAPRARPHRGREPHLFGGAAPHSTRGTANGTLRSTARTASPGQGTRRSSEHRAPHPTGTGNRTSSEARPPPQPGHGRRHSSERRAHGLTGTGNLTSSEARPPISNPARAHSSRRQGTPAPGARQTALFGAPRARPRRNQADGALRGTARQAPPGQGRRRPSGHREPRPVGTGNRPSSEDRPPISPGQDLVTGWAPRPLGQGRRRSSEHRPPRLAGTATPSSSEPGRPTPPEQGTRTSSEARRPRLGSDGDLQPHPGNRRLSGHRAPGPGTGIPALLGGPDPPSHGPPATPPLGAGPPATRGQGSADCTPPASADWRSATAIDLGRRPTPGRTVTAGRQRPQ